MSDAPQPPVECPACGSARHGDDTDWQRYGCGLAVNKHTGDYNPSSCRLSFAAAAAARLPSGVTVATDALAQGVRIDDEMIHCDLQDGRTISIPLSWYPRLYNASYEDRNNWELIGKGLGIHWPTLDEDLSVKGFMAGVEPPRIVQPIWVTKVTSKPTAGVFGASRVELARRPPRAGGGRQTGDDMTDRQIALIAAVIYAVAVATGGKWPSPDVMLDNADSFLKWLRRG